MEKLGRRKPGLDVKSQPDHQVNLQGTGVITKGVPADGEIQFFGFPDYHGEEKEEGKEEYEYYEDYDESGEGSGEEESGGGGGMSNLEKALLAAEAGMLAKKAHSWMQGRKNGSSVGDQSTMSMKRRVPQTELKELLVGRRVLGRTF